MKKWAYKIIDSADVRGNGVFKIKKRSDLEAYLRDIGEAGWEIINLDFRELEGRLSFTGVAKRSVDAQQDAQPEYRLRQSFALLPLGIQLPGPDCTAESSEPD